MTHLPLEILICRETLQLFLTPKQMILSKIYKSMDLRTQHRVGPKPGSNGQWTWIEGSDHLWSTANGLLGNLIIMAEESNFAWK